MDFAFNYCNGMNYESQAAYVDMGNNTVVILAELS